MKRCIIVLLVFAPLFSFSQDYYSTYEGLMAQGQLDKIPNLIELWQNENPKDANVYITGFNHYLTLSREQRIIRPVAVDSTNAESSLIQSEVIFKDSLFNISQDYINKGLVQHPKRLDMHLGKIHALWMKGEHRKQTSEILGLINLAGKIKYQFVDAEGNVIEDAKDAFSSIILEHVANLFTSNQFTYVKQISERMIKSFPKKVAHYSNMGAVYKVEGNYKKAVRCFKKALKLSPNDIIVLNNLGETYHFMEKPKKAKKYYNLMIQHGNPSEQQFAKDKIQEINLIYSGS